MDNKNITFIGAGKMASAIIKGLLSSKTFDDKHIFATEVNEETAKRAKENFNIKVFSDAKEGIKDADIILIATKPFVVQELLEGIKDSVKDQLIISIAAGITCAEEFIRTKTIKEWKSSTLPDLSKIPAIFLIYK